MPSRLVLVSKGVLVLSQPSDVNDLVPSRLVSAALLSPTRSTTSHICLSQAYGCSDRYRSTVNVEKKVFNGKNIFMS